MSLLILGLSVPATAGSAPTLSVQSADPRAVGSWTVPFEIPDIAIHAVLVPTGDVLMFVWPSEHRGSEAWLYDPDDDTTRDVSLRYRRDLFCGGHSLLPDGRVLVTGGTVYGSGKENGVAKTDIFDPFTETWSRGPRMAYKRWYPTNVSMPDGRTLIFSGQERGGKIIKAVEVFDPSTETISRLPRRADKRFDLYPSIHVLPDGRLLKTLNEEEGFMFDAATSSWSRGPRLLGGGRWTGNSVLLTGADRILAVGGGGDHSPKRSAEELDLTSPVLNWVSVEPMTHPRLHANAVPLPDGSVLIVGGNHDGGYGNPVKTPELFDPTTGSWTSMAPHRAPRAYHSTALLLPDGRVMAAGQDAGRWEETAEIYSPPYLFRGERPVIEESPDGVGYGGSFELEVAGDVSGVTLMRPSSVTHAVNFDQRLLELDFDDAGGTLEVEGPATPELAPPGYYMLFAVDAAGVPSEAAWVHLGTV